MTAPALLVFADDWGRHPSSCQHLVRQLLGRSEVYWVNTIGMRPPRLDPNTVRRALGKVRQWLRPGPAPQPRPENPRVINPKMWPWLTCATDRWLNRKLLVRQLGRLVRSLPAAPVAVTTLPIVADLMDEVPVRHWVYYCVDDFTKWPGLDQAALSRMEERLVARADVLIAVSHTLQDRLADLGRESHLLTHGVDLDFWRGAGDGAAPELAGMERPLVLFWGVIDRRMDVSFLRRLVADMTRGTVVLLGPEDNPDPALRALPRVCRLGVQQFERLPALARAADVLVMPYADLPVTRAMQPLKLKEYLATDKPVVVRDLPASLAWADALDLARTPAAFSQAVRRRLETGLPAGQRQARARLASESWAEKARLFEEWALTRRGPAAAPRPLSLNLAGELP